MVGEGMGGGRTHDFGGSLGQGGIRYGKLAFRQSLGRIETQAPKALLKLSLRL